MKKKRGPGTGPPVGHPCYHKEGDNRGGRPWVFTEEKLNELAESLDKWVDEAVKAKNNFLMGDWCFENKFLPQNFPRYTAQNENFKESYLRAKAWQEHMLVKGALFNKLSPKFAQFMLSCNHGWQTKEIIEHKGNEAINVVYYGTKEPKKWETEEKK